MKGKQLATCVFNSGKCLYRLVACACRNSVPSACYMGTLSNVDQFLLGSSWLRSRILLPEPIFQQTGPWMSHEMSCAPGPSVILKIEKGILHLIGKILSPVPLQTMINILNPIGHPWNMLQDEDLETQEEHTVTSDEVAHCMNLMNLGLAAD